METITAKAKNKDGVTAVADIVNTATGQRAQGLLFHNNEFVRQFDVKLTNGRFEVTANAEIGKAAFG